jgi:hypothetical protein
MVPMSNMMDSATVNSMMMPMLSPYPIMAPMNSMMNPMMMMPMQMMPVPAVPAAPAPATPAPAPAPEK